MENRKRRRNANKDGSKWKIQAGNNNTFSQDIIERIIFSIFHEIENIIYTFRSFQYRRYMKNHGPDRMTFDDS